MDANPSRVLFFAALLGGLIWGLRFVLVYAWRRRASPRQLLAAALAVPCGLGSGLLGGAHLIGVLRQALAGRGFGSTEAFVYDFRFYSLVLVGLLIAVPGLLCLYHARGLARGEGAAWKRELWLTLWLLGVNLPLIPIQGFARLLSGLALANLIGLAASQGSFPTGSSRADQSR